jgi:hypothetical protein
LWACEPVVGPFLAFSEEAFALLLLYSGLFFVEKNLCFKKNGWLCI